MPLSLYLFFFFFNDTATTEIYTLSLHDALPIYRAVRRRVTKADVSRVSYRIRCPNPWLRPALCLHHRATGPPRSRLDQRHTSSDSGLDRAPDHRGIPLE